jgi:hypothetical protein
VKPNTKLPKGARLLKPRRMAVGEWLPQMVDARLVRHSINWYRVAGGFGGRNDREDWIAQLPATCVSVSDYNWRKDVGVFYPSFEAAMDGEIVLAVQHLLTSHWKAKEKLADIERALEVATAAVARRKKGASRAN